MFNQGDIVKMDFNPQSGHEQAGFRPALIVSNNTYNLKTGLYLVCPITNTHKGFPFHVELEGTKTKGVVLCEHVKSLDIISRNAKFIEPIVSNILDEVLDIIYASIEIEN